MTTRIWMFPSLVAVLAAASQPSSPSPVAAPMRPLIWGQLNFLQTTDTHGWHAGHLQEPQYSADWGDYISFATRMRQKADDMGVDLLLVDTGDRVEGNGLYDASIPKGLYTYELYNEQDIDIICTGNHELYQLNTSAQEYEVMVPNTKGKYLASNLDYIDPKTGNQIPMAQRYRKFTTKNQGIRVLAFGFLFDFKGNAKNTVVQPVEKTIKEEWFQDAIREDVDLFVVAGHVTLHGPEYKAIYKAIRSQRWDTPIQFFGGHSHVRDFAKYDSQAYALQSGRYMETIGWMSIDGIKGIGKTEDHKDVDALAKMSFQRRYIDNNLFGYHYHTGLNDSTFPTEHGKNVSAFIHASREALGLDQNFGCAPRDLWLNRAQYPSNNSLLTWLEEQVLPDVIRSPKRKDVSTLAITNTGAMRFDIFKGRFTRDTTYIISPFISKFQYIKDVPYASAKGVLALLNNGGPIFETFDSHMGAIAPEHVSFKSDHLGASISSEVYSYADGQAQAPLFSDLEAPNLVPGYTTKDDGGDDGDDTVHAPISFYRVPNCIQAAIGFPENGEPETVDLVFIDYLHSWILLALTYMGASYNSSDVLPYIDGTLSDLMVDWIQENWKKDC